MFELTGVLHVRKKGDDIDEAKINALIEERNQAKKRKNFQELTRSVKNSRRWELNFGYETGDYMEGKSGRRNGFSCQPP